MQNVGLSGPDIINDMKTSMGKKGEDKMFLTDGEEERFKIRKRIKEEDGRMISEERPTVISQIYANRSFSVASSSVSI
jgi:hypothetical protein